MDQGLAMSQLMKCRLKHAGCMGTIYMVGGAAHRLAAAMQGMPAQWKPIWPWAYVCVACRSVTTALGWLRKLAIIVCICPLLACCRDRASASGMLGECKALVFHLGAKSTCTGGANVDSSGISVASPQLVRIVLIFFLVSWLLPVDHSLSTEESSGGPPLPVQSVTWWWVRLMSPEQLC